MLQIPLEKRAGDAFGALFERYRKSIMRVAFSITLDYEEALDVSQDVFLRAYIRFDDSTFADETFRRWLFAVARNASIDVVRRRKLRDARALEPVVAHEKGPCELIAGADEASRLRVELEDLRHHQRRALEMYYFEDLSYREIAEGLAVPLGTVKTFLFRGLRSLRKRTTFTSRAPAEFPRERPR